MSDVLYLKFVKGSPLTPLGPCRISIFPHLGLFLYPRLEISLVKSLTVIFSPGIKGLSIFDALNLFALVTV